MHSWKGGITIQSLKQLIGREIKYQRTQKHISQEKLAELSELHPTYIGQLERGEKNATVDCLWRILKSMDISMAAFFEKIDTLSETSSTTDETLSYLMTLDRDKLEILRQIADLLENYGK